MRSVADRLREADRHETLSLTPDERVALALRLGLRDIESFRRAHLPPLGEPEARRVLERRRQSGRRRSGCLEELIG